MTQTMSHMSPKQRRNIIRDNILFKGEEEMAKMCNVSRRTIVRDIQAWRRSGGFTDFLHKEFMPLYSKEKITNPSKALDRICYLLTKDLQYGNVRTNIDDIKLKWATDESNLNDTVPAT